MKDDEAEIREVFDTHSIEVQRTHDCNGAEDYHQDYHHYTDTVQYLIVGNLAELIRLKVEAPEGTPVYFTEFETECGYSEFTQETGWEFEVQAGEFRHRFGRVNWGLPGYGSANGVAQLLDWLGEGLSDE